MNLVILDDDPLEHLILEKMINLYGPSEHVRHSSDGDALLKDIAQHKLDDNYLPDIMFVDIHMPGMNGWDFLDQFEKVEPTLKKHVGIYILSSSIDPGEIYRSKKYPFVKDYIIKPITIERLKSILI